MDTANIKMEPMSQARRAWVVQSRLGKKYLRSLYSRQKWCFSITPRHKERRLASKTIVFLWHAIVCSWAKLKYPVFFGCISLYTQLHMTARLRVQPRSPAPRCFSTDTPLFQDCSEAPAATRLGVTGVHHSVLHPPSPFFTILNYFHNYMVPKYPVSSKCLHPDAVLFCQLLKHRVGRAEHQHKAWALASWEWDSAINYLRTGSSKQTMISNLLIKSDITFLRLVGYAYSLISSSC